MTVTLNLTAEAVARLEAEAARRWVTLETVINKLAAQFPAAAKSTVSSRRGLIGLGASPSGERASDADAVLAEGFGRD